jgi:xanthine dehydrogenase accessory factor
VRYYLTLQGLSETDLLPLKAPAGLDIQARRGDEIALSIMAEIVQRRRNAELLDLAMFHTQEVSGKQLAVSSGVEYNEQSPNLLISQSPVSLPLTMLDMPAQPVSGQPSAVDPICGMTVETANAKYTHVHEGTTYYFCCAGCKAEFGRSPEQYVASKPVQ